MLRRRDRARDARGQRLISLELFCEGNAWDEVLALGLAAVAYAPRTGSAAIAGHLLLATRHARYLHALRLRERAGRGRGDVFRVGEMRDH